MVRIQKAEKNKTCGSILRNSIPFFVPTRLHFTLPISNHYFIFRVVPFTCIFLTFHLAMSFLFCSTVILLVAFYPSIALTFILPPALLPVLPNALPLPQLLPQPLSFLYLTCCRTLCLACWLCFVLPIILP